jgi:hypothetical protein
MHPFTHILSGISYQNDGVEESGDYEKAGL